MLPRKDTKLIVVPHCYCGRELEEKWGVLQCPHHKGEFVQTKKRRTERIAKYSGPSKRYRGMYEDY
ncbi:hypothetical protein LCGC14_1999010 [marine sediment metagenome]|uniref:Uncharacterized protein n=1 Tax=marine sediment metagenome TaxID=412755 RepID=A0A0F9F3L1_9ZZZZ